MDIPRDIYFLILALVAEILGTIGGFGSSVFFVPVANFFLDFQSVLGLIAIFHLSSNISKIALFRKGIDRNLILYLGIPAVLFVIIGAFLSKYFETKYLELILGLFLVILSLFFILRPNFQIKKNKKEAITGGVLSGLTAGLLGTGGAIRGLTMAAFNLEKSSFIATSAIIDFGVDFSRTIVYVFNGYISREILIYIPFLLLIGFLGTYIGKQLLKLIPQQRFRMLSLVLILIIGLGMLYKLFLL